MTPAGVRRRRPSPTRRLLAAAAFAFTAHAVATPAVAAQSDDDPVVPAALRDARWPATERAAERGLAWLAAHQQPNGSWLGHVGHKQGDSYLVLRAADEQRANDEGHLGVTSLAGLAFLAAGHLPDRGAYGEVVGRTLRYVLGRTRENGVITDSGTRMYSHAFATLFLAQVLGATRDTDLRRGLERAVHIVTDTQNDQGGWRYNFLTNPEADLSVTVCQVQALRAARNVGIRVSAKVIADAVQYVRDSQAGPEAWDGEGLFYYRIRGVRSRRKNRQYAINAAALTSLFSAGVRDERLQGPALSFLEREYGDVATHYNDHYYFWYGNYYASQAFFQAGGDRWRRYYDRVTQDLLDLQRADGSWRNRVGPGDAFSTAVACLILEIPYQYLPIFQR